MATSAKWRILIDAVQGGSLWPNVSVAEMQMRITAAGADQCTGGTATASGDMGAGFEADKAFDDNAATQWKSGTPIGAWLQYEFTSSKVIVEYALQARDNTLLLEEVPVAWRIQYFDGTTWQTRATVTGEPNWSVSETRTYSIPPATRVTQLPVEAVSNASPTMRTTQLLVEAVSNAAAKARLSQLAVEVVSGSAAAAATTGPVLFIAT